MVTKLLKAGVALTAIMMLSVMAVPVVLVTPEVAMAQSQSTEMRADELPLYRKFLELPGTERDKLSLVYFLRLKGGSLSQVTITLVENGKAQKLNLTPDGRIQPLPTLSQMNNGARLVVSGPVDASPALKLKVVSTLPAGTQYDGDALVAGLDQSNRVTKKVAGAMAAFLPRLTHVYFVGATSGVAVMADGSQKPLPQAPTTWAYPQGTLVFSPSAMPNVQSIRLNSAPVRVIYDQAVK